MKLPLNALSIVVAVTLTALFGMVLGGLFGYCAASIAPDLFRPVNAVPQPDPRGIAVFLGSFGGVLCGGSLGVFAIVIQALATSLERSRRSRNRQDLDS